METNFEGLDSLPTVPILERILCDLIVRRESIIVRVFKSSIIDDHKFLDHIRNLTKVLCMDWNRFYNNVIALVSRSLAQLLYIPLRDGKSKEIYPYISEYISREIYIYMREPDVSSSKYKSNIR